MYTRVASVWLTQDGAVTLVQRDLLNRALQVYEALVFDPADDSASRRARADAYARIGEIRHLLGDDQRAIEALQTSLDLAGELVDAKDISDDELMGLARRYRTLASVEESLARWDDAYRSLVSGDAYARQLVERNQREPERRFVRVLYQLLAGQQARTRGYDAMAEKIATAAIKELALFHKVDSERLEWLAATIKAELLLVDVQRRQGRSDEAHKQIRRTLDGIRSLRQRLFHDARELVQLEAEAREVAAAVEVELGDLPAAAAHLRQALVLKEQNLAARRRPGLYSMTVFWGRDRGNYYENYEMAAFCGYAETQLRLAKVLAALDRPFEAEQLIGESVMTGSVLCGSQDAKVRRYMLLVGNAWASAAELLAGTRPDEAEKATRAADLAWRAVAAWFPGSADDAELPANARQRLAWHEKNGAGKLPERELQAYRNVNSNPEYQMPFNERARGLGWYHGGHWADSVRWFERSAEMLETGQAYDSLYLAMAHHRSGKHEEAKTWFDRAATALGEQPRAELLELRAQAERVLSGASEAPEEAKDKPANTAGP
jgi:tetratricopeptide (TPR) repeat protein